MFTDGSTDVEIYTPVNQNYVPAWAPQLCNGSCSDSSNMFPPTGHHGISGTGFNGMSQATMFGDDSQMATNYPLVRIIFGGEVIYCRSYSFSSMGVATGNLAVSTDFDCSNLPLCATGYLKLWRTVSLRIRIMSRWQRQTPAQLIRRQTVCRTDLGVGRVA